VPGFHVPSLRDWGVVFLQRRGGAGKKQVPLPLTRVRNDIN